VETLVSQKRKKGYVEVGTNAKSSTNSPSPAKRTTKSSTNVRLKKTPKKAVVDSATAIPKSQSLTFVGLVDPSGGGGGMASGRGSLWEFAATLAAWKAEKGPLVRQPILLLCNNVGNRKLNTLMKQFENWRLVKFTARRSRRQTRPTLSVELDKYIGPVRDKDLSQVKKELRQPVEIEDSTFGTLQFDREMRLFTGELSHRGEQLYLWVETESTAEAREMLKLAKPLWRSRTKWFKEFQALVVDRMLAQCNDWRDQDEQTPLTKKEFLRLLGDPVGLVFRLEEGQLSYDMSGSSEELFTDHGITAWGTLQDGLTDADMD
jgi:hypothetical protein